MYRLLVVLVICLGMALPIGAVRGKKEFPYTYWLECVEHSTDRRWLFQAELVEGMRMASRLDLWGRGVRCELRAVRIVNPVIDYNPKGPSDVQAISTQEDKRTR